MRNGRELKRIKWSIIERIIVLLHHNRNIKKTSLAMRSGLGYDKCLPYLDWMEMMGMIKRVTDEDGSELIRLNDRGEQLYQRKFKDSKIDFMREYSV